MSLPPAEDLSRWTVGNVNTWLSKSSLTVFRDEFLRDAIDGSKLMRMQPYEIDSKYPAVPARKRQILKDCLSKIESPKSSPSWNNPVPQRPPRPGPRAPASLPAHQDDDSEDGWGSDFVDDIGSDDEDYLEPTTTPHLKPKPAAPGGNLNGHNRRLPPDPGEGPQSNYEIPAETVEETRTPAGLSRRTSLVDRLKNELQIRKHDSQVQQETPPPRPPRVTRSGAEEASYSNTPSEPAPAVARHRPPPPQPQLPPPAEQQLSPPNDVYEIVANDSPRETEPCLRENKHMYRRTWDRKKSEAVHRGKRGSDDAEYLCPETADIKPNNYLDFSETCKKLVEPSLGARRGSRDMPLPPRPIKEKVAAAPAKPSSTERPLPPHPQQQGGLFNRDQAASGDDLSAFEWYHGKISRDHAQKIFHREQTDGMFLIRKSERDPLQPYTLVIWHCNRIWNIPIRKVPNDKFAAGKMKEGENHFDSLPDLIDHFKVVSLNLKSNDQVQGTHNLTVPAPRQ